MSTRRREGGHVARVGPPPERAWCDAERVRRLSQAEPGGGAPSTGAALRGHRRLESTVRRQLWLRLAAWRRPRVRSIGSRINEEVRVMVESSAEAVWEGSLQDGQGRVKPASGSFPEQTVTWRQR